jgi:predicted dehydrogenase
MQAVLDLLAAGRLNVTPLISHRFPIAQALDAYELIEKNDEPYLGLVLEYQPPEVAPVERRVELSSSRKPGGTVGVGVLGAGNFARLVLLPELKRLANFRLAAIGSAGGVSAAHVGRKLGFEAAVSEEDEIFSDPAIDVVFSLTRHDQHAGHVLKAIQAGKPIFVEKPLCRTQDELQTIEDAIQEAGSAAPLVMVGFNRRFSPAAVQVQEFFQTVRAPRTISIRFNAGAAPPEEWIQQGEIGGGRIVGEACHAIDLATYLAGSPPVRVFAESIGGPEAPEITDDQCFITLRHANGSVSSVAYLAGGDRALPKERIEVFGGGRAAVIDDFRSVTTSQGGKVRTRKLRRQDKGHQAEIEAFARAVTTGGPPPIPWSEIRAVTLASFLAVQSLREGTPLDLGAE